MNKPSFSVFIITLDGLLADSFFYCTKSNAQSHADYVQSNVDEGSKVEVVELQKDDIYE